MPSTTPLANTTTFPSKMEGSENDVGRFYNPQRTHTCLGTLVTHVTITGLYCGDMLTKAASQSALLCAPASSIKSKTRGNERSGLSSPRFPEERPRRSASYLMF